jgi:hypothetical protein
LLGTELLLHHLLSQRVMPKPTAGSRAQPEALRLTQQIGADQGDVEQVGQKRGFGVR